MNCALCDGKLSTVIKLNPTPPANELLIDLVKQKDQDLFDLNLTKCNECNHLQLDTEVQKERLFSHYVYVSDTGQSNRDHFKSYAEDMTETFAPRFVVDIGSNDGLFLTYFNCKVLGVDPAANINKKVETIIDFFNEKTANSIFNMHGKADLITCNNMFAHNRDLSDFVNGVKKLLSTDGTFVFEVAYALPMLKNCLFDLIYHEHYHHWHVSPMMTFFNKFGLKVVNAEHVKTHGGSIRVFVKHKGDESEALTEILKQEKYNFVKLVNAFGKRVSKNQLEMKSLLQEIKQDNKTVSILGYPAKACTLSYAYNLTNEFITNVYDDNKLKIGLYTHQGFQIKASEDLYLKEPDYLLILSWNYADDLIKKHSEFKGKFIIPFPTPTVMTYKQSQHSCKTDGSLCKKNKCPNPQCFNAPKKEND